MKYSFIFHSLLIVFILAGCANSQEMSSPDDSGTHVNKIDMDHIRLTMAMIIENEQSMTFIDRYESVSVDQGFIYPLPGNPPITNVTWYEADSFCRSNGKRLCTRKEWIRACVGMTGKRYSYDSVYDKEVCKSSNEGKIDLTGSRSRCKSDHNVYDMVGNANEWVNTEVRNQKVIMGGNLPLTDQTDCFTGHLADPSSENTYTGFRCCLDINK